LKEKQADSNSLTANSDNTEANKKQVDDKSAAVDQAGEEITNQAQQDCLDAYCFLHAHGIEPNLDEAIYLFNKSANSGDS